MLGMGGEGEDCPFAFNFDEKTFKVGDTVGVGCLVGSCQHCAACDEGLEQYCESGFTGTYNGPVFGGENTFGGYSQHIVVDQRFVLRISHTGNLAAVAPLLCAGITTYSPLRQWKVGPTKRYSRPQKCWRVFGLAEPRR